MRTGIALGRPLVPRMGQMFQWPGGGVPPIVPLSAQQAFSPTPLTLYPDAWKYGTGPGDPCYFDDVEIEKRNRCEATQLRPIGQPSQSSQPQSPQPRPIGQPSQSSSLYEQYKTSGLRGLGLGNGSTRLGSHNNLGAAGIPLLASSIVSIPLQAAATWVGFHTGSKETGWLSAAGYVVGIVGAIGTLVSLLGLVVGTAVEVAD